MRSFARKLALLTVALAAVVIAGGPRGGPPAEITVDWFTVDGGGISNSLDGEIEISGTIGQPDAGRMTGTNGIEVVGGFWAIPDFADCNNNKVPDSQEIDGDEDGVINACDICPDIANAPPSGVYIESHWNSPFSGNWTASGNWTPPGSPNNTSVPIATNYRVTIAVAGAPIVTCPPSPLEVDKLTIGSGPTPPNEFDRLVVIDMLTVNHCTYVDAGGQLTLSADDATLSGGGVKVALGGKIVTAGQANDGMTIDADLDNAGRVEVEFRRTLNLLGEAFTNRAGGVVEVKTLGALAVTAAFVAQSGTISAVGGAGIDFSGGEVVNSNGASIILTGGFLSCDLLRNLTGGTVTGTGGQIDGNIVNAGDISFTGDLVLNGDVTILPGGVMSATGDFNITGSTTVEGGELLLAPEDDGRLSGDTLNITTVGVVDAAGPVTIDIDTTVSIDSGGEFWLRDTVSLDTGGNLQLNSGGGCRSAERGCTPVRFNLLNASLADVNGSLFIGDSVMLNVESSESFLLGGAFNNQSIAPEDFHWENGSLTLDGTGARDFEAAGEDLGPDAAGLVDNFAIGRLKLTPATGQTLTATIVDSVDNQQDDPAPCEALYVRTLVVSAGATLNTGGCHVYYLSLTNAGNIPGLGTDVQQIMVPGDCDDDGDLDLSDWVMFRNCITGPLGSAGPGCTCAKLDADADVDLEDYSVLQSEW